MKTKVISLDLPPYPSHIAWRVAYAVIVTSRPRGMVTYSLGPSRRVCGPYSRISCPIIRVVGSSREGGVISSSLQGRWRSSMYSSWQHGGEDLTVW